jgi:predicted amidohydrolase YtcJ
VSTAPGASVAFVNGNVWSAAPSGGGSALAIADGRILAVGSDDEVRAMADSRTEVVDLKGRMLLPGFQDAHVHASGGGLERTKCDLSEVHSLEDYRRVVAEYAAVHTDVDWIVGGGWSMDIFPRGVPSREDLDAVVGERPVFLSNRDHHGAWVSTAALRAAGITRDTPDPPDGRIERDEKGEPCGTLQEGAMRLVQRIAPAPTTEDFIAGILAGQRYLHSLGITAWQEAIVGNYPGVPDCFEAYRSLDSSGKLTGRVVGALWWERDRGEEQIDRILARREAAAGCERFRATSIKFMQDGICENFTAAMLTPYLDGKGHETHNSGKSFFEPEELRRYVTLVDGEGFQAHFHAIGDRAVREVLDAIEAARRANPSSANRHHIAHIQVIHPEDVPRFAALGAAANAQALWACSEPQMTELTIPFLGEERATHQYPFGSLVRAGAKLSCGSDWPVSTPDPLQQIHVAVNRTAPPGYLYGRDDPSEPFLPDERLDLATVLEAFTSGSAYVNGSETESGSLEPGKRADVVVLSHDLFSLPAEELAHAAVDMTFVDGQAVYERQ